MIIFIKIIIKKKLKHLQVIISKHYILCFFLEKKIEKTLILLEIFIVIILGKIVLHVLVV